MALLDRLLGFRGEPDYVRTSRHDGGKSVDVDEFFKDKRVRQQLGLEEVTETNGSPQEDGATRGDSKG